jgi:ADP-heptose:LPS heptosyltransferase
MKIITFKKSISYDVGYISRLSLPLKADREYLFFDKLADRIDHSHYILSERTLDSEVPIYNGENLNGRSLLFSSLGGFGDALCLVQALNSLKNRYPDGHIDLAVTMDTYLLLERFGFNGGWLSRPVPLEYLKHYDFFQSAEALEHIPNNFKQNVARLFCELLSVPVTLSHTRFAHDWINHAMRLTGSNRKRVSIQVDSASGNTRSYSPARVKELALLLSAADFEVYLVGFSMDYADFSRDSSIHNLVNRLSTILDLAEILSQMDMIIAPDSVGGHLGGSMGIPTIVLFSVTGPEKMDHYPSVYSMQSQMSCSPCYKLDECPEGHSKCRALDHVSVSPAKVLEKIRELMRTHS